MTRGFSWSTPLFVGAIFGALSTLAPLADSDLFWHLAQGRQTIQGGLARADAFSWSANGTALAPDQWLGQVLWYLAYVSLGWHGIALVRALCVALIVSLTLAAALFVQGRPVVALVASLPGIGLSRYAWSGRPQLMGLVCFAALCLIVRVAGERPRVLVLAPALILLWANLHASFVLGLVLVVLVAIELAIRDPGARRLAALVAVASVAASLVTPAGPAIWTSASGHFFSPPRFIQEEGVPDVSEPYGLLFAIVVAVVSITAFLARTTPLRDVVFLGPILFVSWTAARHTPFFAIASAPYLAAHGPEALSAIARALRLPSWGMSRTERILPPRADVATAALGAVVIVAAAMASAREPDLAGYPVDALSALPPGPGLFNDYDWGGFLIWYAPATPVFVDGRLFPYMPEVIADYRAVLGLHAGWEDVIARRNVRALLVRPDQPLAARAQELGWRVLSASSTYVLLARP